jgi:hypothetical protein
MLFNLNRFRKQCILVKTLSLLSVAVGLICFDWSRQHGCLMHVPKQTTHLLSAKTIGSSWLFYHPVVWTHIMLNLSIWIPDMSDRKRKPNFRLSELFYIGKYWFPVKTVRIAREPVIWSPIIRGSTVSVFEIQTNNQGASFSIGPHIMYGWKVPAVMWNDYSLTHYIGPMLMVVKSAISGAYQVTQIPLTLQIFKWPPGPPLFLSLY